MTRRETSHCKVKGASACEKDVAAVGWLEYLWDDFGDELAVLDRWNKVVPLLVMRWQSERGREGDRIKVVPNWAHWKGKPRGNQR